MKTYECLNFFAFIFQQTVNVITAKDPPLRHQTNKVYMPMTALKHADPTGRLPLHTFYKMIFKHDRVFSATLGLLRLLQRRAGKKWFCEYEDSIVAQIRSIIHVKIILESDSYDFIILYFIILYYIILFKTPNCKVIYSFFLSKGVYHFISIVVTEKVVFITNLCNIYVLNCLLRFLSYS